MRQDTRSILTSARRSAGQYRRYGYNISYDFSNIKTRRQAEQAKTDIELQVIRQRVERREEQERRERERKTKEAALKIDNIKAMLLDAARANRASAQSDMQTSAYRLLSIIDYAVDKYGEITTAERLEKFAAGFYEKLIKIVRAIYDDYYNTNLIPFIPDEAGETGRNRYINSIEKFAADLGVSVPRHLL